MRFENLFRSQFVIIVIHPFNILLLIVISMSKVVDKVKKTVSDAKNKVMDVGDKAKDTVTGTSNDRNTTKELQIPV